MAVAASSSRVAIAARDAALLALQPLPLAAAAHSAIPSGLRTTSVDMTTLQSRLGAAVAKLVLLPVVGVSLCGAVTLLLTLQWVEALQRQRQQLRWRARLWATVLAFLLALLPSKRLEAAVKPCTDHQERGDGLEKSTVTLLCSGKREGQGSNENVGARPLKRQKSGSDGKEEEGKQQDQCEETETAVDEMKREKTLHKKKRRRVFIWDLDETLVLFASLYTGTFAQTHGKEVAPGVALGEQMMTFLLAMLERHFFFSDLHDADVDHIGHVGAGDDLDQPQQELRERYERIREIYERRGDVDFLHDTDSEWFAIRRALVSAIDSFSTGWLHEARQVLELITQHQSAGTSDEEQDSSLDTVESSEDVNDDGEVENVNVLVTNTQLVPALCKCLIYQLDTFFPIERVYSSAKIHKYRCFETIMTKYEVPDVEFVAIGDGLEEEQVSLALGLEFHKVRSLVDLKRLRYDLQLVQNSSGTGSTVATANAVVSSAPVTPLPVASPVSQTAVV